MSSVNIDWRAIRPINGSRQEGFEELCCQLAEIERPKGAAFNRKGKPDAGVECYATLQNGSEWGWQAKYFDKIGNSQWSQIDKSVRKTIEKHPQLVRYYVCVPFDLPDARMRGRRSAKKQWDDHVKKWTGLAGSRNMNVEFVYWGSYELLSRLSGPEHVGRLRFWFNSIGFDKTWFNARLNEAVKAAGARYTPEIHVDLPIAATFEAFGRTGRFCDRLKVHALDIRKELRSFEFANSQCQNDAFDVVASASKATSLTHQVLEMLVGITPDPVGSLPFLDIKAKADAAISAAEELERMLFEQEKEFDAEKANHDKNKKKAACRLDPFLEREQRLPTLKKELLKAYRVLEWADSVASHSLLLLTGDAGTGKTHLLCDIAKKRVEEGLPTILLMGQRFLSQEEPWIQALQHLDLSGLSVEEFVGAMEAAAQASGCRALLLIDALNEGSGTRIWLSHLAAFLTRFDRSPWIAVVLSVRSSYEPLVVPDEVRDRAVKVTHSGFAGCEYDATRTFLVHYGIELPSTPLLAPEFNNPLFLKLLCQGLNAKGERRLPRGFQGITAIFNRYLDAVNELLAEILDFNPSKSLVRQALEIFAKTLFDTGARWLPLAQAEEIVNALLPGRTFQNSLYRALVAEEVLIQNVVSCKNSAPEEVAFVAYDRFADHLVAKFLLDEHLDEQAPEAAFAPGAPLGFLSDSKQDVAPSLLEALSVQIPERTGKELTELAPAVKDQRNIKDAFRQSIVWRDTKAFSKATLKTLNEMSRTEHDRSEDIDMLLTVTTLPGHPLNAEFLDNRLRRDAMPDRDAWWSVYLHHAWRTHGAVDRLIDWAVSVRPEDVLDDESVDLCATALSWMFTTSNRFLRDHATTALVNLLTGRLDAVARLVDRFGDVDDLYVLERIYAIAYGAAMRSDCLEKVGALAILVYNKVFASGAPPTHILLRDYARGVVERALHLGSKIDVDTKLIRPPYQSVWPIIPTEEDIKPLLPNWSRGAHDGGEVEWARNRIGSSVMDDDFARYVIGTNWGFTNWLSLRLDEPPWQSPDERLAKLLDEFSQEEKAVWERFREADDVFRRVSGPQWFSVLRVNLHSDDSSNDAVETREPVENEEHNRDLVRAIQERDTAAAMLESTLTVEHASRLEDVEPPPVFLDTEFRVFYPV